MSATASTRPLRRRRHGRARLAAACTLALALTLALAAESRADVGATIIERCTHGQSLSGFTEQDYRQALRELPTEVEEYSDCANLIRHAELAAAGGGGGGAGGAGAVPIPLTPAERAGLRRAAVAGGQPLEVGDQIVRPGVVPVNIASALNSLPTPLLATLAFLLACLLLVIGGAIRDRVRARRTR
ncbi:MAG TPA: hypothetical protein VEJ23_08130 [Solirubrobacteraceae bacterium]|nr:hypothetical protein [Solirubrobacteraceae bacterium]